MVNQAHEPLHTDPHSQVSHPIRIPMIGELAPSFTAQSTQGEIVFPENYHGKYVVFFSHPADFTPICSSEFMLFGQASSELKKMNVELLGISQDSLYSHIAWLTTIKDKLEYKGIKNMIIPFPVIADMNKKVIHKYGMVHANNEFATRSTFIIGPEGKIRAFMFYPMYNGRSITEIVRLIKAMQRNDKYQVATPGEWHPSEKVIDRIPRTFEEARLKLESEGIEESGVECYDWFSCFKKDPES